METNLTEHQISECGGCFWNLCQSVVNFISPWTRSYKNNHKSCGSQCFFCVFIFRYFGWSVKNSMENAFHWITNISTNCNFTVKSKPIYGLGKLGSMPINSFKKNIEWTDWDVLKSQKSFIKNEFGMFSKSQIFKINPFTFKSISIWKTSFTMQWDGSCNFVWWFKSYWFAMKPCIVRVKWKMRLFKWCKFHNEII